MEELIVSPWLLAVAFGCIATVYGSVGLGGGSSYTALLAIFGLGHRLIPSVSLSLNVVVTVIGAINFARHGHVRLRIVAPLLVASLPLAYLGGSLQLPSTVFYAILLGSLVVVAARIYLWERPTFDLDLGPKTRLVTLIGLGATLGLLAGIVGIGGGIYLVPILILLGLGSEKEAAAAGAIFIAANSASGLFAHLRREVPPVELMGPLLAAVVIGGFVGSQLGADRFSPKVVRRTLGLVILVAIVLLARRLLM
ncbi:MAG: sulfite exporter TauE/SafE family protein [Persicimonas sp.]